MFYNQTLKAIEIATWSDNTNRTFILKGCIRKELQFAKEAYALTQTDMLYPAIQLDKARRYIDQLVGQGNEESRGK